MIRIPDYSTQNHRTKCFGFLGGGGGTPRSTQMDKTLKTTPKIPNFEIQVAPANKTFNYHNCYENIGILCYLLAQFWLGPRI